MQKNSSPIINKEINKKNSSSEDEKEEKDLFFFGRKGDKKNSR
ncbi:hypothetical protein [Bacteroides caecimuris]|nr:hypothetical protein [Bacteroides caecimuris]